MDKALDLIIESSYSQMPNHIVESNNAFPTFLRYAAYGISAYGLYRVIKHFIDEK